MRYIVFVCVVVGCSNPFTVTKETLDEVGGTCTFEVQYRDGGLEQGKQTLTVRPYAKPGDGCSPASPVPCDWLRDHCTERIGYRPPVYETIPKRE